MINALKNGDILYQVSIGPFGDEKSCYQSVDKFLKKLEMENRK